MRNTDNELLVSFDSWDDCVKALNTTYTLSLKDMCKKLKCSRSWANRYLKPHLHYVYISNGSGKSPNYLRAVNLKLDQKMTACTWYSEQEFNELIKLYTIEISRQTKRIPIEMLISPDKLDYFYENFITIDNVRDIFEKTHSITKYQNMIQARNELVNECATEKGAILWNDEPSKYKRTDTPIVKCDPEKIDMSFIQYLAIHDMKDYGDVDETVYRKLFEEGCYKLVLQIPDIDGVISEKVYYFHESSISIAPKSIEFVLVKYENYIKLYPELNK